MTDCIFCEIIQGKAEASFVYRDEVVCAFMDIQPVNPGHVLVAPARHAAYLSDLDEAVGERMFRAAHRLTKALRASGLRCEGVNLFLADGAAAMQEVFHVHLHAFPRFVGDGFGLKFGPGYLDRPGRGELQEAAKRISCALDAAS